MIVNSQKYNRLDIFGMNVLIINPRKLYTRPNLISWVEKVCSMLRRGIDTPILNIQIVPYLTNREFNNLVYLFKKNLPNSVTNAVIYKRAKRAK